jgi:hypothetical protein
MCVILVCPENIRPGKAAIAACHRANPDGAGVAWRENGKVLWMKGLSPCDVEDLISVLPGEIVIHFRWASVGAVTPKLCHPFPVTARATTRLSGHARTVLFHNGTWDRWRESLYTMPHRRMAAGPLSDTRVAASLVDYHGFDMIDRLPGRWVLFDRDFTELYGDWHQWDGMRASNLYFEFQNFNRN